ncbi:hypothetical protein SDC9_180914 [bioreactor metagenome]|uniref:Uncharacterized protein n=1 Tax=bioreactor metagenome TaxID=1076179 RepID=A0A645H349_9ZZZZ
MGKLDAVAVFHGLAHQIRILEGVVGQAVTKHGLSVVKHKIRPDIQPGHQDAARPQYAQAFPPQGPYLFNIAVADRVKDQVKSFILKWQGPGHVMADNADVIALAHGNFFFALQLGQ